MKKFTKKKIRYAVVGLGHISQIAVLPSFKHAKNSELVALVSGNEKKLKALGKKYGVEHLFSYEEYDECLKSGLIDAVYIALPNHMHRDYTERAARAGIHVLCEKPLAVTVADCESMLQACRRNGVKLMTAYRLHFEEANLALIELLEKRKIGEPRIFHSAFTLPVQDKGIRTNPVSLGGGPLYDIGIYCINAARYLFQSEPIEVSAIAVNSGKKPFLNSVEGYSVSMRFPGERLANFVLSYDCTSVGDFQVLGTKGNVFLENAYEYVGEKIEYLTIGEKEKKKKFGAKDQFAPELIYFSECILKNLDPEPAGVEGLADIQIIQAILKSVDTGSKVRVEAVQRARRPSRKQEIDIRPIREPEVVETKRPSAKEAA